MNVNDPAAQKAIYAAWDRIGDAVMVAMHDMDADVLRFLAERAEGNSLVSEAARDILDNRGAK